MSSFMTVNLCSFLFIWIILIQFLSSSRIKIPLQKGQQRNVLSPRTIKIKYGNCRGSISSLIIIDEETEEDSFETRRKVEENEVRRKVEENEARRKVEENGIQEEKTVMSKTFNDSSFVNSSVNNRRKNGEKLSNFVTNENVSIRRRKKREREVFVEVFKGIPFASPPVGSLRFMPPVTPSYWRGTRLFTSYSPVCPQGMPMDSGEENGNFDTTFGKKSEENGQDKNLIGGSRNWTQDEMNGHHSRSQSSSKSGQEASKEWTSSYSKEGEWKRKEKKKKYFVSNQSEDCLYLNIFTPFSYESSEKELSSRRLPVLVIISSDSLLTGNGNQFDGSILAHETNIIVVTINYRLGILGFLPTLIDGRRRGNFGLLDCVAALHWVQDCIGPFGGDVDRVTVAGQGVGAQFVELLLLTPLSRGLFSRGIIMSGSSLSPLFGPLREPSVSTSSSSIEDSSSLSSLSKLLSCPSPIDTSSSTSSRLTTHGITKRETFPTILDTSSAASLDTSAVSSLDTFFAPLRTSVVSLRNRTFVFSLRNRTFVFSLRNRTSVVSLRNRTSGFINTRLSKSDHQYHDELISDQDRTVTHKAWRKKRETTPVTQEQMMECIRSKSWEEIIKIQNDFLIGQNVDTFKNLTASSKSSKQFGFESSKGFESSEEFESWKMRFDNDIFKPLKIGLVIDGLVIPRDPKDAVRLFPDQSVGSNGQKVHQSVDERLKEQMILSSMLTPPSRATNGQPFKSHDLLFGFRSRNAWKSLLADRPKLIPSIEHFNSNNIDPMIKSLIKNSFQFYQEVIQLALINEYSLKDGRKDETGKQSNRKTGFTSSIGSNVNEANGDSHKLVMKESMSDLLNDFLVSSPMVHFSDSFYSLVKKMDPERMGSSSPTGVTDRSLTPGQTGSGGKRNQTNGQVESIEPSGRIFSYLLDIQDEKEEDGDEDENSRDELFYLLGQPLLVKDSSSSVAIPSLSSSSMKSILDSTSSIQHQQQQLEAHSNLTRNVNHWNQHQQSKKGTDKQGGKRKKNDDGDKHLDDDEDEEEEGKDRKEHEENDDDKKEKSNDGDDDDVSISNFIMNNWSHFLHFGKPCLPSCGSFPASGGQSNHSSWSNHSSSGSSSQSSTVLMSWPEYDPNNRPFLYIHKNKNQGLKINISSNYKKHRINFWNELIPSLQKLGGQESIRLIQYLKDSNDNSMIGYGEKEIGVFNTIQLKFLSPITSPTDLVMKNSSSSSQLDPKKNDGLFGDLRNQLKPTNSLSDEIQSKDRTKGNQTMVTTRLTTHLTPTTTIDLLTESALGLTITLGILLLLINLIIFMSIFTCYKKITGDGDDHGHNEMISCDGDKMIMSVENHHKSMSSQSSSSHPMSAKHQLSSHPLPTQSLSFHQNSPAYRLRQCETMHRLKSSSSQSNSPSRISITGSLPREKKVMFADLSTNHVLDPTSEHIQNMTNPMCTTTNQMSDLNQISSNLNQIPIPNQMSNHSNGMMTTVVDVSCHHHHQDPQLASDSSNCDSGITVTGSTVSTNGNGGSSVWNHHHSPSSATHSLTRSSVQQQSSARSSVQQQSSARSSGRLQHQHHSTLSPSYHTTSSFGHRQQDDGHKFIPSTEIGLSGKENENMMTHQYFVMNDPNGMYQTSTSSLPSGNVSKTSDLYSTRSLHVQTSINEEGEECPSVHLFPGSKIQPGGEHSDDVSQFQSIPISVHNHYCSDQQQQHQYVGDLYQSAPGQYADGQFSGQFSNGQYSSQCLFMPSSDQSLLNESDTGLVSQETNDGDVTVDSNYVPMANYGKECNYQSMRMIPSNTSSTLLAISDHHSSPYLHSLCKNQKQDNIDC